MNYVGFAFKTLTRFLLQAIQPPNSADHPPFIVPSADAVASYSHSCLISIEIQVVKPASQFIVIKLGVAIEILYIEIV